MLTVLVYGIEVVLVILSLVAVGIYVTVAYEAFSYPVGTRAPMTGLVADLYGVFDAFVRIIMGRYPKGYQIHGRAGSAFQVNLGPVDDRVTPEAMAHLGRWNMYLPDQHPLWGRYVVDLCHLRDYPCMQPAEKLRPDVTHQIVVAAIDPKFPEVEFQRGNIKLLMPLNHLVQFRVDNDRQAVKVLESIVGDLVQGKEIAEPVGICIGHSSARNHFAETVERYADRVREGKTT